MQSNRSDFVTPHTLTGEFRHHENFASVFLDNQRPLIVYLPPDYDSATERRYPVLYLNDGQNVFDSATAFLGQEWQVDETAQQLIAAGEIEPLIIAGVYNTGEQRIHEYTPTHDERKKAGGLADLYGRFLIEEVKPFIDKRYRTLQGAATTALGGSSLGGLVTLHLGLKYPQVFGKLLVMSPSVWWDHGVILREVEALRAKPSTRIWLDMGTKEGQLTQARLLRDALIAQGWRLKADLHYLEARGARHTESAWAKRVAPALKFLFGKS